MRFVLDTLFDLVKVIIKSFLIFLLGCILLWSIVMVAVSKNTKPFILSNYDKGAFKIESIDSDVMYDGVSVEIMYEGNGLRLPVNNFNTISIEGAEPNTVYRGCTVKAPLTIFGKDVLIPLKIKHVIALDQISTEDFRYVNTEFLSLYISDSSVSNIWDKFTSIGMNIVNLNLSITFYCCIVIALLGIVLQSISTIKLIIKIINRTIQTFRYRRMDDVTREIAEASNIVQGRDTYSSRLSTERRNCLNCQFAIKEVDKNSIRDGDLKLTCSQTGKLVKSHISNDTDEITSKNCPL